MHPDPRYMDRCLELAARAAGTAAPNPMVGAVLVHGDRIIGEGWHAQWGGPHAEVQCLRSVPAADRHLIPESTLYVSLEPCAHFGRTPPCADLIMEHRIPRVAVAIRDPFPEVAGRGLDRLQTAGVEVQTGFREKEAWWLNRRFFTSVESERPYIILKWAQTANGKMAAAGPERLQITGPLSARIVHRWRSEESAIMVGTRTALLDDPELTTRHWPGRNPVRIVLDAQGALPPHAKVLSGQAPTIVFRLGVPQPRVEYPDGLHYWPLAPGKDYLPQMLQALHALKLRSVLVEGGARLLQSFLDAGIWDEARVLTNTGFTIADGLNAPALPHGIPAPVRMLETDLVQTVYHPNLQNRIP